jgi:uncharacterized protein YjiS (DUF1127 family)
MIGQIKNIRFTYQFTSATVSLSETSGRAVGVAGATPAAAMRRFVCLGGQRNKAMTALTTSFVPSSCTEAFAVFGTMVVRVGRRLAGAWRHRHDATALASLDDRMLADIGLTRADLNDALAEPLWRDPTTVLARRRGERRWARRAASPPLVPGPDALAFPPRDRPARLTR